MCSRFKILVGHAKKFSLPKVALLTKMTMVPNLLKVACKSHALVHCSSWFGSVCRFVLDESFSSFRFRKKK